MVLLCGSCRWLGAPASWSVIEGNLRLGCARCGEEASLPPTPAEAAAPAITSVQTEAAPGPVAEPMAPRVPAETGTIQAVEGAGDWLEAAWERLSPDWDDPAAHHRLIAEAAARDALAALGARYRMHLLAQPGDERALAARDELLRRAAALLVGKLPGGSDGLGLEQAKVVRNVILVLFGLLALAAGVWIATQLGGSR